MDHGDLFLIKVYHSPTAVQYSSVHCLFVYIFAYGMYLYIVNTLRPAVFFIPPTHTYVHVHTHPLHTYLIYVHILPSRVLPPHSHTCTHTFTPLDTHTSLLPPHSYMHIHTLKSHQYTYSDNPQHLDTRH